MIHLSCGLGAQASRLQVDTSAVEHLRNFGCTLGLSGHCDEADIEWLGARAPDGVSRRCLLSGDELEWLHIRALHDFSVLDTLTRKSHLNLSAYMRSITM